MTHQEFFNHFLKMTRRWEHTLNKTPRPKNRTGHEEMTYQANLAVISKDADKSDVLTTLLPKVWQDSKWRMRLLSGKTLKIEQGKAQKGRKKISLSMPFTPKGVAEGLGYLFGWTKHLDTAPNSLHSFLYINTYGGISLREGLSANEAIAYEHIMTKNVAKDVRTTFQKDEQKIFELAYNAGNKINFEVYTTNLPSLWGKVFTHPVTQASSFQSQAEMVVTQIETKESFEKTAIGQTLLESLKGFKKDFEKAKTTAENYTQSLQILLDILDRTSPRTGQEQAWVVTAKTYKTVYARDAKEALIISLLEDLIQNTLGSDIFDRQAFPLKNVHHGHILEMAD